jgi:flagellar biosynthesis protein FliP
MTMRTASLPIALIVFGIAWLLWYFRMFPDIDWIIAAGMAAAASSSRRYNQATQGRMRASA